MKIERTKTGWSVQVRMGAQGRRRFTFLAKDEPEAQKRAETFSELGRLLSNTGWSAAIQTALTELGTHWDADDFAKAARGIRTFSKTVPVPPEVDNRMPTVERFGKRWTSGELHAQHPDHVKKKKSVKDDRQRLERLYKSIGKLRLDEVTIEHAQKAMSDLGSELTSSTRRQYAQVLARLFKMAVFPCLHIPVSPIPDGFLPKAGKSPLYPFLYPSEDRKLLACQDIPIGLRALYGFCVREGMRKSGPLELTWAHLDLTNGVINTGITKTGETLTWKLDPGTTRALRGLRKLSPDAPDTAFVFPRVDMTKTGKLLRGHLKFAGVDRPELFNALPGRAPIRFHDLRASFITIALANGRSEAWVTDRSGHTTSQMLYRYKRRVRLAAELELGDWAPLDVALALDEPQGVPASAPFRPLDDELFEQQPELIGDPGLALRAGSLSGHLEGIEEHRQGVCWALREPLQSYGRSALREILEQVGAAAHPCIPTHPFELVDHAGEDQQAFRGGLGGPGLGEVLPQQAMHFLHPFMARQTAPNLLIEVFNMSDSPINSASCASGSTGIRTPDLRIKRASPDCTKTENSTKQALPCTGTDTQTPSVPPPCHPVPEPTSQTFPRLTEALDLALRAAMVTAEWQVAHDLIGLLEKLEQRPALPAIGDLAEARRKRAAAP